MNENKGVVSEAMQRGHHRDEWTVRCLARVTDQTLIADAGVRLPARVALQAGGQAVKDEWSLLNR